MAGLGNMHRVHTFMQRVSVRLPAGAGVATSGVAVQAPLSVARNGAIGRLPSHPEGGSHEREMLLCDNAGYG